MILNQPRVGIWEEIQIIASYFQGKIPFNCAKIATCMIEVCCLRISQSGEGCKLTEQQYEKVDNMNDKGLKNFISHIKQITSNLFFLDIDGGLSNKILLLIVE